MPKYRVTSPDGKTYEVNAPDGASQDQVLSYAQEQMAKMQPTPEVQEPAAPNTGMMSLNSINKGIAAIPDAVLNTPNRILNLGKAAFGTAATAMGRPDLAPEPSDDPNFVRRAFDAAGFTKDRLEPVTPGQRVLDTTLQGAVAGAVSPASGMRQAISNAALGGVSGAAAGGTKELTGNDNLAMAAGIAAVPLGTGVVQSARNKAAAMTLRKQQNSVRDQTIADARNAGYVLSPSETNPGTMNQALEGIAGKLSTRQLASQRNQDVTNSLVRRDLGVDEGSALSPELLAQLRKRAYDEGYTPVTQAGEIRPGSAYRNALDDIAANYTGAASSFPRAVKDEVSAMVDSLRVRKFDAGDAVKMAQILRDDASKSYASGDKGLGKAQRSAANAIEDQLERGLQGQGKQGSVALDNFRDARKQIAKTHTIENALFEGTGNVQASKLAAALRKGAPLSGDIATAARAAESFPKNMQSPEVMGAVPGISPLDVLGGAGIGAAGAAATGSASGALLGALPAVRPLTRAAILSGPYQKMMGAPKYKNSALTRFLAQGDIQSPTANAALMAQILANQE